MGRCGCAVGARRGRMLSLPHGAAEQIAPGAARCELNENVSETKNVTFCGAVHSMHECMAARQAHEQSGRPTKPTAPAPIRRSIRHNIDDQKQCLTQIIDDRKPSRTHKLY